MSGGLPVDKIVVADGRRAPDPERVRSLSGSIADLGLLNPVTVVPDRKPGLYQLLAGLHRLEACKALGWKKIPANVVEHSELYGELVEIDENLIRFELSDLDRAVATNRRKEIYLLLHPDTGQGKTKKPKQASEPKDPKMGSLEQPAKPFVDDTASKTGRSRTAVGRDAQIGAGLTDDEVGELRGTSAENNQRALLSIAKESDPELRRQKIEEAKAPKPRAPRKPKMPKLPEPATQVTPSPSNPFDAAQRIWLERIPKATRASVLELGASLDALSEGKRLAFWAWAKGNDA